LVELHNWISAQENVNVVKRGKRRVKTGVGLYHYVSEE
jgi:hypothetical protein